LKEGLKFVSRDSHEDATCTVDVISHSSAQTQRLGMRLGELLRGGELILLDGQLGAGKTTFTQGLAQGMNISAIVNSPTFTLLKEYSGRAQTSADSAAGEHAAQPDERSLALYHFDLYRLDEVEEIIDLGFEDYFYGSGVSVVEWAEKASALWPADKLYICIKALNETKRTLLFRATGARYCELLRQFQKNTYATASS